MSIVHARRRSRVDAPIIKNSTDSYDVLKNNNFTIPQQQQQQNKDDNVPLKLPVISLQSDLSESYDVGSSESNLSEESQDCENIDNISFELVTGYVYSSPKDVLDSIPGTLMLTDCLEQCQLNESCKSINYETGLCVLFASNADKQPDALSKSQFPVFTIYAQKSCLKLRPCERAWCIDRVQGYALKAEVKRSATAVSRQDCYEMCFGESDFLCRSANWIEKTGTCELLEMDRLTLGSLSALQQKEGVEYLENNCAEEPNKLCEFKRVSGKILKTVDSVYQDVGTVDECRELCLSSPYRCHSYDYGDTGELVCRLSHHSRATLTDVQDPYLEVPEAATYELSSCYNVTIECRANEMIAKIRTSKLFDGKVYAKGAPNSCSTDVKNALEFELKMGYQNIDCNVRQNGLGRFLNDVVIQHHDMIVTSSDLGLAITCTFDLTNKTVSNDVDLGVTGDIEPALSEEVIVDSPNVIMKITTRDGSEMKDSAEVGDPLALKFEILDESSPYEIFVRELVAMDGADSGEITLIDSRGCPTDNFVMGPIYKSAESGKILLSKFDAFKFPSSQTVQFRALVTPCLPTCEPVQCDEEDFGGELRSIISYGKRKRRSVHDNYAINVTDSSRGERKRRNVDTSVNDDMLLVQSIQITDKFGFTNKQQQQQTTETTLRNSETVFYAKPDAQSFCVNGLGLILTGTIFLLAQLAVITVWTVLYGRRQKQRDFENSTIVSQIASTNSRSDSMCKLYESEYSGHHF
ncbi:hypothetical protein PVAND_003740 [Polypedilum vanderplanki]|uniref:Uncharacterized protein n=1 Tax=Polypedilum vanderplanki TaxID=319348 RepID=A0A9J6BVI1_POLVA|nr:hypothetical protein PVAND_003740 [Polypedilum vanderplanki]